MKNFYQNKIQANAVGEPDIRSSVLPKATKKQHTIAITAIFSLIILHFASQFFFFKVENSQIEKPYIKSEIEQPIEIKTEYEAKNLGIAPVPQPVAPEVQPKPEVVAPLKTVIKKKEPRESRTERLRRAERILTGV